MDRLVSKIIAGGLSAGVFLFWWPDQVAGEGPLQLVLRGLLWTLSFEVLLLTLGPAERLIQHRIRDRAVARGERVRTRLAGIPAPARTSGVVALACFGVAAPLALIADAPSRLVEQVDTPRVVKQVVVERPVVEKKIVVRKVVAPAAHQPLQSGGAAPPVGSSQVARAAAPKATVAPERTSATTGATKKAAPKPTTAAKAPSTKPAQTPTMPTAEIGPPASGTATEPASAQQSPTPAP